MEKKRICFATEIDLGRESAGGVVDDQKFLSCLREFDSVDLVHLQKKKYKSKWLALVFFLLEVVKGFFKPCQIYFSRGLVTTSVLVTLKQFFRKQKKIVHKSPVPFPSNEVRYLRYNKVESFVRYCIFRFLERVAVPRVDAIILPSSSYAAELVKNRIEKNKVYVIPYYIEDEFFEQPLKRVPNETFTFCYIGSFHSYHDLSPLIEGFEQLSKTDKKISLVLVGDGMLRPEIEKMVLERKLQDKIRFRGRIPHSYVPSFLSGVDSFVYLARTKGMSTSLLEAAAAGKPILTFKKKEDASLARYFRHGKEIFMVNSLSPMEIAEAMKLLYIDSRLRSSLSNGARKVAQRYFNREAALRQLNNLMREICNHNVTNAHAQCEESK